ncbi:calcineurin-like phosphoesterase superfamily domain protein [Clostridium puniceum]|uniref:Calcineurin-like phosphoesterase superfamily domain protein n=1 Tax=Clostridium puniceum TaxID=29367 RepID=A0A1S8TX83_9CLOT|nr:metallophosphoesterase [Clostridium puniceum]OOM82347.1 calcineurin-like phosphoesterase superfamily domain protein [Clostridium puniceum]
MGEQCTKSNNFIKRIIETGKLIEFNEVSRIVFISDVHRGNGGYADSLRQNRNIYKAALGFYCESGYTLIELGDGDELWKNKDCLDIAYNYKDIFAILNKFYEEDRLCLVFGNHDIVKSSPEFIREQEKLFEDIGYDFGREMLNLYRNVVFYEGVILRYTPLDKDIIAFHGHQVDLINCDLWKSSRFLVRYVWRFMEGVAGFKSPTSPASNYNKGSKIDKALEKLARKEKKMIICGHTHNDIFPEPDEGLYFNDGCCVFPSAVTCIEITNGEISLVKWQIEVGNQEILYINKTITGGPEKIEKYLEFAKKL